MAKKNTFTIGELIADALRNSSRTSRLMDAVDAVREREGRTIASCSGLANITEDPKAQKRAVKQCEKGLRKEKDRVSANIATLRKAIPDLKGNPRMQRQARQNLTAAIAQRNDIDSELRRLRR